MVVSIQSPPGNHSRAQDSWRRRIFPLPKLCPSKLSPGKFIPPTVTPPSPCRHTAPQACPPNACVRRMEGGGIPLCPPPPRPPLRGVCILFRRACLPIRRDCQRISGKSSFAKGRKFVGPQAPGAQPPPPPPRRKSVVWHRCAGERIGYGRAGPGEGKEQGQTRGGQGHGPGAGQGRVPPRRRTRTGTTRARSGPRSGCGSPCRSTCGSTPRPSSPT